jgi:hypothetical protein
MTLPLQYDTAVARAKAKRDAAKQDLLYRLQVVERTYQAAVQLANDRRAAIEAKQITKDKAAAYEKERLRIHSLPLPFAEKQEMLRQHAAARDRNENAPLEN